MTTPGPGRYATHELQTGTTGYPSFNATLGPHAGDAARRRRLAREQLHAVRSPQMRQPTRGVHRDIAQGEDVVAYLATGAAGAAGTRLHKQTLMRLLREAAAAADAELPQSR